MAQRPSNPDAGITATSAIDVTFGRFQMSDFHVPYMSAVLSMDEVATYLELVTDDPTYAKLDWSIDELYQREVDPFRVREIADQYLAEESAGPQFFNSLTVVLRVNDELPPDQVRAPSRDARFAECMQLGPVTVSYDTTEPKSAVPASKSFGSLRWNREQVWATAIDGQHRLAAIRRVGQQARDRLYHSDVSVIFLVIHSELGFEAPGQWDTIRTMRRLFIDLNKRAVPVTKARNLLLDDLDPGAEFVRRLLGRTLQFEQENGDVTRDDLPIGKDDEFLTKLPLEAVDWHSESKAKVERGPYITSILAIDWIVGKILKEKDIRVPERFDLQDVEDEEQYDTIAKILRKWPHAWEHSIETEWADAKATQAPFYLQHHHVEALGDEFEANWGPSVTHLLTRPIPYRGLVELRLQHETFSPQFGQWYQRKAAADNYSRTRLSDHYSAALAAVREELSRAGYPVGEYADLVRRIEDEIKSGSVFYYLVGQRALVWAFLMLESSQAAAHWASEAEIDLNDFAESIREFYAHYLVEAVNEVYRAGDVLEKQLFEKMALTERTEETADLPKQFWAGALLKRDAPDQMDYGEKGAFRGAKWFVVLAHLYWFMKVNRIGSSEISEMWLEEDSFDGLPLGSELRAAIADVFGRSVDTHAVYHHPMSFLVYGLEEEQRSMRKVRAAGVQRLRYLAGLVDKALEEA